MPVDRRITRLSPGFHRARQKLGIATGSPRAHALAGALRALAAAEELPSAGDYEAEFRPGYAFIRRVPKQNLWLWYRVDADFVTLVSITDNPPVPAEKV